MEYIDSHLEMESNSKVRAEMEYMGGKVYKTYRVFGKALGEISEKEAEEELCTSDFVFTYEGPTFEK